MGFLDILAKGVSSLMEQADRNRERAIRDYEHKVDKYERTHGTDERVQKAREQLNKVKTQQSGYSSSATTRKRRTDAEFDSDKTGTEKRPRDFQYRTGVPLNEALSIANNEPGVYILCLHGSVMKCGRAAYGQGIHWRFQQYYSLKYDDRARKGEHWAISEDNRDDVTVSWQCCPASKCHELEYKLFKKYGKGAWAKRGPQSCSENSWELLI